MTSEAGPGATAVASARPQMTLPMLGALLVVTVIWGVNFAVVKTGLNLMPAIAFVALRFAEK